MKLNERIKLVRAEVKENQERFAETLKISRNYVSLLEKGDRNPSDRTLDDICEKYHVNPEWLKNGEGEMFVLSPEKEMAGLAQKYNLSPEYAIVMEKLLTLPEAEQDTVVQLIIDTAKAIHASRQESDPRHIKEARLLREEADAVEQEWERLLASRHTKDA